MPKPRTSFIGLGLLAGLTIAAPSGAQQPWPGQQAPPAQQQPAPQVPQEPPPQQPAPPPPQGYPQQPAPPPQGYPQQPAPPPQGYPPQPAPPPQGYPPQPAPPPQGYPPQPTPPPQGYPQQPPQAYPPQPQQPLPPLPGQGYPQQQPPQGYPPQQPPQSYRPQQPYPQQQQMYPPPQQQPPPPNGYGQNPQPSSPLLRPGNSSQYRSSGEMVFLYGTGLLYGVGTGIWADALGKLNDPGLAFIAPLAIGAAVPIGIYFWDDYAQLHRGVPSSIATGLSLGALEGIAISGTQWQHSGAGGPNSNAWSFATEATVTWSLSTVGGLGGYAFGEWLRPDPRSLGFISSGAGWGAIAGTLFGAGLGSGDWRDGASIAGLVGYNVGMVAAGALSVVYVPSWQTQKWMWAGFAGGTAAASVVYFFYIGSSANPRHGLIANAVGGAAGLALAAILTANMTDAGSPTIKPGTSWTPPFQFGITPVMNPGTNQRTGAVMSAFGTF